MEMLIREFALKYLTSDPPTSLPASGGRCREVLADQADSYNQIVSMIRSEVRRVLLKIFMFLTETCE